MNITEESSDALDHYSMLSLALPTSGGTSISPDHTRAPSEAILYILTCVDASTEWAEAFPLCSKEAEPIAKVLIKQIFCRFGSPVSLLSDQGKELDGNIMKHVCRMLGIDKLRTSPYKPSTNQVERLHRSINAIL